MIKVIAHNFVREGCLDEFLAVAKILEEETNKYDAGCISFAMHQNLSDPMVVTCIEEWDSTEAQMCHLTSAHFLKSAGDIQQYSAKPVEFAIYKKLF